MKEQLVALSFFLLLVGLTIGCGGSPEQPPAEPEEYSTEPDPSTMPGAGS